MNNVFLDDHIFLNVDKLPPKIFKLLQSKSILELDKTIAVENNGNSIKCNDEEYNHLLSFLIKNTRDTLTIKTVNNDTFIRVEKYYRLHIPHDFIIDFEDDLDITSNLYVLDSLKDMSVSFEKLNSEEFRYIIYSQKCDLPFDKINEIISFIECYTNYTVSMKMYDFGRYELELVVGK